MESGFHIMVAIINLLPDGNESISMRGNGEKNCYHGAFWEIFSTILHSNFKTLSTPLRNTSLNII